MTLYGLSILGVIPILAGLPFGYAHNELDLQMEFIDLKANKVLFSKKYQKQSKGFKWFYFTATPIPPDKSILLANKVFPEFVEDSLKAIGYLQKKFLD